MNLLIAIGLQLPLSSVTVVVILLDLGKQALEASLRHQDP